jgi:hypothetical protein
LSIFWEKGQICCPTIFGCFVTVFQTNFHALFYTRRDFHTHRFESLFIFPCRTKTVDRRSKTPKGQRLALKIAELQEKRFNPKSDLTALNIKLEFLDFKT